MKKILASLLCAALLFTGLPGVRAADEPFVYRSGGLYGIMDAAGRIIVPPEYISAYRLAHRGDGAVSPLLFAVGVAREGGGLAYGIMDAGGNTLIEPLFDDIYRENGILIANGSGADGSPHAAAFTTTGEVLLESAAGGVSCGGYLITRFREGRGAVHYNMDGSPAPAFAPYAFVGAPSNGLLRVSDGELYGYADMEGELVIEPQYSTAGDFFEGHAFVTTPEGAFLLIDTAGGSALTLPEGVYASNDGFNWMYGGTICSPVLKTLAVVEDAVLENACGGDYVLRSETGLYLITADGQMRHVKDYVYARALGGGLFLATLKGEDGENLIVNASGAVIHAQAGLTWASREGDYIIIMRERRGRYFYGLLDAGGHVLLDAVYAELIPLDGERFNARLGMDGGVIRADGAWLFTESAFEGLDL